MPSKYNWLTGPYSGSKLKEQGSKFLDFLSKPLLPERKVGPVTNTIGPQRSFWQKKSPYIYDLLRSLTTPKDLAREAAMIAVPAARVPGMLSFGAESVANKDPLGMILSTAGAGWAAGGLGKARKAARAAKTSSPITAANEAVPKGPKNKYWRGLKQEGKKIVEVGKITAKDGQIKTTRLSGSTIWKGLKSKQYTPEQLDEGMLQKAFNHYNKKVAPKTTGIERKAQLLPEKQISSLQEGLAFKPGAYTRTVPNFGGKSGKGFKEAFEDFANADRQAQRIGDDEVKKQIRKGFGKYLRAKGYKDAGGKYTRNDIRQVMNNYYDRGRNWSLFRDVFAPISQTSKNLILSSGIPKTGVNWFGSGMVMRTFLDPKGKTVNAARMMFNPEEGARVLKANKSQIPRLVRAGLDFSAGDNIDIVIARRAGQTLAGVGLKATSKGGKALDYSLNKLDDWFGEPLFGRVIPALKVQSTLAHEAANVAKGMKPRQALKQAVRTANGFYSGNNWKAMVKMDKKGNFSSRSPELNDFLRSVMLAPTWLQSNARIGKGALTLATPEGRAYRSAVGKVIGMYAAASVGQKASVGHFMHENAPGKRFDLQLPGKTSTGRNRYVPMGLGTAADFARLPMELAFSVFKDKDDPVGSATKLLRNRISAPLSASINLLANVNYRGDALTGKDRFGRPIGRMEGLTNQGTEVFGATAPQQVKAALDYGRGKVNLEEALVEGLELPLRYHRPWVQRKARTRRRPRRGRRSGRR